MTNPDDGMSIPDFLDRRHGRSGKEIYEALDRARKPGNPLDNYVPPKLAVSKRGRKIEHDDRVVMALRDDGPGALRAIVERTGLAVNEAQSAIRRCIKAHRIERLTKRTYRRVER